MINDSKDTIQANLSTNDELTDEELNAVTGADLQQAVDKAAMAFISGLVSLMAAQQANIIRNTMG